MLWCFTHMGADVSVFKSWASLLNLFSKIG